VWDDETFYHLRNGWTPVSYFQLDEASEDIWRSGVVADHVYLFDIDKVDLARYRAIVFANTYCMSAARRAFVRERVAGAGRHLIWNYLPGYTDGARLDLSFVQELTGMRLAPATLAGKAAVAFSGQPAWTYAVADTLEPGAVIEDADAEPMGRLVEGGRIVAARKRLAGHTSVHAVIPLRGPALYRQLMRDAGCHVYCESNDPVYVSSGLLMLHTGSGGRRAIRLKSGRAVTFELKGPATILLDAVSGKVLLGEFA